MSQGRSPGQDARDGYDLTVVIPTFNERENIDALIRAVETVLSRAGIRSEILVVDDSSPDGTIQAVGALAAALPNVRLVVRRSDPGLSQSVVEGFSLARAPVIQVMDADFSHPPDLLPRFFEEVKRGADVVIGSRYMPGGGIEAWPASRRIISSGATLLGRLLFPEITDPVSGFFAVKRGVVSGAPLRPRGYKILMEVLGKGTWEHAVEVPYTFENRKAGASKLHLSTIVDYARQVLDIAAYGLRYREGAGWKEMARILKFGVVGLTGILVNMGLLAILTEAFGIFYLRSSAIAIEVSIVNNFVWNDLWTFGDDPRHRRRPLPSRLLYFHAVSVGGAALNWAVLFTLTEFAGIYYLVSNLAGILTAFVWNYLVNRNVTWRG